mgnify:CR=1 FL=1
MFILHPDLISRAALSAGEIAKPCLYLPLHHQSSVDLLSPRYLQQEHADDKYGGVLVRAGSPCWCATSPSGVGHCMHRPPQPVGHVPPLEKPTASLATVKPMGQGSKPLWQGCAIGRRHQGVGLQFLQ